jgi:hypothetical protein
MVFFPGAELNRDPTNWWAPNIRCMDAMLRHVGFKKVEVSPAWGHDGRSARGGSRYAFRVSMIMASSCSSQAATVPGPACGEP